MRFDTKIVVILRGDLAMWQKLNVTTFLVSGIAATVDGVVGAPYEDASGQTYLPMFVQPALIFSANADEIQTAFRKVQAGNIACSIFTEDLFATGHDEANRAAVKAVATEDLQLVGVAFRIERKVADKIVKELALHS